MTNRISLFLSLVISLIILSCSKSDNTERTSDVDLSLLSGTWTSRSTKLYIPNQFTATAYYPPNSTFNFSANGIFYQYSPDSTYQIPYSVLPTTLDLVFTRPWIGTSVVYDTFHITSLTSHQLTFHGISSYASYGVTYDTLRR